MSNSIDPAMLREVLKADVKWSAYALGDLAPELFHKCQWIVSGDRDALLLIYRGFQIPVLFSMGRASSLVHLIEKLHKEESYFLSIRPDVLQLIEQNFSVTQLDPMIRMVYKESEHEPEQIHALMSSGTGEDESVPIEVDDSQVANKTLSIRPLSTGQIADIEQLFLDGQSTGESPDCFTADMVKDGCFFGVFDEAELVAVAGTHLVVPSEKVAAIGCVYTRRTHRSRGLAKLVTAAVLNKLISLKVETIVLNVKKNNRPAIRVYESLGFVSYCPFYEGVASPIGQVIATPTA
jgi:GNAT superfamily N-acetyltransferase